MFKMYKYEGKKGLEIENRWVIEGPNRATLIIDFYPDTGVLNMVASSSGTRLDVQHSTGEFGPDRLGVRLVPEGEQKKSEGRRRPFSFVGVLARDAGKRYLIIQETSLDPMCVAECWDEATAKMMVEALNEAA